MGETVFVMLVAGGYLAAAMGTVIVKYPLQNESAVTTSADQFRPMRVAGVASTDGSGQADISGHCRRT